MEFIRNALSNLGAFLRRENPGTDGTLEFIRLESNKPNPNMALLLKAMASTYEGYRKDTYDRANVTLVDIKKFHGLQFYQTVKQEYELIMKKPNKMMELEGILDNIFRLVLNSEEEGTKPGKKATEHNLYKQAKELLATNKKDSVLRTAGIIVVCYKLVGEAVFTNLFKILNQEEHLTEEDYINYQTPTVVVNEEDVFNVDDDEQCEVEIFVDGKKFLVLPNIYQAVLTVYATYYVLNINYDTKLKRIFEYFDMLSGIEQYSFKESRTWPPTTIRRGRRSMR